MIQLGTARQALSVARTVQEAKHIADVAAAAEVYARRVKLSGETIEYAQEIRLRAERLLGEMLARAPKRKGRLKRGSALPEDNNGGPSTLAELGVTKQLSSQAQRLAAVPVKVFEQKLATGERRPTAFIRTKTSAVHDPRSELFPAL